MNRAVIAAMLAVLGFAHETAIAANGPTATFNEAVRNVNGKRVVDVAPFPSHMQFAVGNFQRPEQIPYDVSVTSIETPEGLMDCVGTLWFHPKACSPSTFGKKILDRKWTVELQGRWFVCGSYTSVKTCVPIIVDGKLRPIPSTRE